MAHDQLFKDLLRAFFREFMQLFFPDVADRLDFSRVTFLDKEVFTDLPQGAQREADLAAQVHTIDGEPEIILTHIEVEARRRGTFPERMFEYFMLFRLRHQLHILPIAVFLSPGSGGLTKERHVERLFDRDVSVFTYDAVGLPDLNADDYQTKDNPLAPALSALMRPSALGKVAQKYQSLRAMAQSGVDEARLALLTNVVETYLILDAVERQRFEALISTPEGAEIKQMISIYEQRGIEKGIEQGIEKGIEQGIQKGIEQGVVRGKRETLLRLLERKFGALSERVRTRVEQITGTEELDRLSDAILTSQSLADMGMETE